MKKKAFLIWGFGLLVLLHAIIEIHDGVLYGRAGRTSIGYENHPIFFCSAIAFEMALGLGCLLHGCFLFFEIRCKWIEMINNLKR
jgi:hypothetical protein